MFRPLAFFPGGGGARAEAEVGPEGPLMKLATMKAEDDGLSVSGKWSEYSPVWVETKPKAPDSWDTPHTRPKNTSSGL